MKLINQLREKLESIGGTMDDGDYTLNLDAPPGYVWSANGSPCLPIHYATNSQSWLAQAVRMETPNLRMGLHKVTDPADIAEHQHMLDDDSWGAAPDAPEKIEWP